MQLHSLGFEGWIIDLFDAPEPVKAYLCKEGSLHLLPYSTRPLSKAQRERIEAHRVNGQPTFQRFVTGDVVYQIKALGNETLARSDSVGDPQYLTGGADSTRKDQLEHRRGEITRQQREVEASLAEFRKQEGVVAQKMKPLEDQKVDVARVSDRSRDLTYRPFDSPLQKPLLAERDHLKSLRSKIGAAQDKISRCFSGGNGNDLLMSFRESLEIKQNAIERLRMSIASNQAEHEEASKAIVKLVDKRINTIRELAKNSDELVKVHLRKYTLMNLRQLKLQAEAKAAADAVSAASAELEEVDRLYQEKKEEHLKAKDLAKAAAEEVEETKRELTDEQMATIVVGLSDISFEQLEQDESTLTAQIENGSKLDRGIITEYNNRKQMVSLAAGPNFRARQVTYANLRPVQLEQKKETIAEKKRDLEAKNSTMNELREQWYPKVTELVRKIDEEFSKHFKSW